MRPSISEFSYGFALVNEFINWAGQNITAVPIYPSLIVEGELGYDVRLEQAGVPLFMQFKLSHCMVRTRAREVRAGVLHPPFYRMHLHPRNESRQHELLLNLEAQGNEVFYAAPEFHLHDEFNHAFLQRRVIDLSWFFRPSAIGPLPDDDPHHVAFKTGEEHGWFFSKPVRMKPNLKGHALAQHLEEAVRNNGKSALTKERVTELTERILAFMAKTKAAPMRQIVNIRERRGLLARLAYIAPALYGAQLFIVQERLPTQKEAETVRLPE
jgi:hypothetical protein